MCCSWYISKLNWTLYTYACILFLQLFGWRILGPVCTFQGHICPGLLFYNCSTSRHNLCPKQANIQLVQCVGNTVLVSTISRFGLTLWLKRRLNTVINTVVIRPLDARTCSGRSAFIHLWLWFHDCSWRHFRARKCLIKRAVLTFSSISIRLIVGCNVKGRRFTIELGVFRGGGRGGRGHTHSIARPWVPISFLLTHMVSLLPFLSYLTGSLYVRPSVLPDTMTNTALEAIAFSSGKKGHT